MQQHSSQLPNAVVVVVEGLGSGLIGAYGSSTAATPAIDRLAAQGILLDQCFVDSHDLLLQLRSLWTGMHAMQGNSSHWSTWREFQGRPGRVARLLTDCEQVAEAAARLGCELVTLVEPTERDSPAEDSSECGLMELFATAAEELRTGEGGLVWIHSRGLRHAWDAPLALRRKFADPGDPEPPRGIRSPDMEVTGEIDPDFIVGWGQVAAAQAAIIDEAVSALMDTVARRADGGSWAWLFTALGGVPLGEHGRLGWGHPQLYGEELHSAAIFRPSTPLPVGFRRPELFQLPDLAVTLAHLAGIAPPANAWGRNALALGAAESPTRWPASHTLAMISTEQQQWIRSPAWSALLESSSDEQARAQLFVKPEDRWEVSDVADRRRDIVARHGELAEAFGKAVRCNDRGQLPGLEDDLCNLMR